MKGLIPFNKRNSNVLSTGLEDFYNVLDDFFSDSLLTGRNLARDTFKIDIQENEKEYLIQAELPGIKKDEITLNLDDKRLTISIKREESFEENKKNYVHRERHYDSMSRSVYLEDASHDDIKAKLEDGILNITIQRKEKPDNSYQINIE